MGNPTPYLLGIFDENLGCEIAKFCSSIGRNTQMYWNIFVRALPLSKFCMTYDLWIIANISLISFIGNMNRLKLTIYISQWEDKYTIKQVCLIFRRLPSVARVQRRAAHTLPALVDCSYTFTVPALPFHIRAIFILSPERSRLYLQIEPYLNSIRLILKLLQGKLRSYRARRRRT